MVDAPVSGATAAAEAASLLVMVGASDEVFERIEPILQSVGKPVQVGPTGSAAVLKLAVNSVLYGLNQAVAEAVALAEKSGRSRHHDRHPGQRCGRRPHADLSPGAISPSRGGSDHIHHRPCP